MVHLPLNAATNHALISNRWNEALHGVAGSPGVTFADAGSDYAYATSFPQPILMGAAFDDELIHAVATVVSTEARAFNNGNRSGLNFWTP
jgi:beta-D-xylosidase 4